MSKRTVKIMVLVDIVSVKPIEEILSAVKRGILRGLDTEPYYIAPPNAVDFKICEVVNPVNTQDEPEDTEERIIHMKWSDGYGSNMEKFFDLSDMELDASDTTKENLRNWITVTFTPPAGGTTTYTPCLRHNGEILIDPKDFKSAGLEYESGKGWVRRAE